MPPQRLLYLEADGLTALRWQGGLLDEEGHFRPDEGGRSAFAAYLAQHRTSLFLLLADVAEEGFQLEELPYTQGADRRALLRRKLGQYFYGSPLATAVSYGRSKEGRRDEKFLLAAFTRPPMFEPWLAALRAAEAQLAGLWSLPLLGGALLARLPPVGTHCLLITPTRAGIRQSFFDNGRLLFSRLKPMVSHDPAEIADACANETVRLRDYLRSQRLLPREGTLSVLVLVHPAQAEVFRQRCRRLDDIQPVFQDLHAAARAIGLKTLPSGVHCESLFLHLLAKQAPREQFAPDAERRLYRLGQMRAWLLRGGFIALFACLLYAGHELVDAYQLSSAAEEQTRQAEADTRRYQAIQATFPPMPTSTENLRAVINRFEELERRSASPAAFYQLISRALVEAPRIELERIEWQLASSPEEAVRAQTGQGRGAAAPSAAGMHVVAIVHGLLPAALVADQRGQLEMVNAFAEALRRQDGLRVTVLRLPFDIESGKSLKSGGETEQSAAQLKFSIQISRRL